MAILERHVRRVLRRQVKAGKITKAQANAVLDNPKAVRESAKRFNGLATSQGFKAIGDGSIISWIVKNWDTILKIIKDILALFGV